MFTKDSALVEIWTRNVKEGNVQREQVPKLSNLQEVVYELLDGEVTE